LLPHSKHSLVFDRPDLVHRQLWLLSNKSYITTVTWERCNTKAGTAWCATTKLTCWSSATTLQSERPNLNAVQCCNFKTLVKTCQESVCRPLSSPQNKLHPNRLASSTSWSGPATPQLDPLCQPSCIAPFPWRARRRSPATHTSSLSGFKLDADAVDTVA